VLKRLLHRNIPVRPADLAELRDDYGRRFLATLALLNAYEDRIGDLEHALKDRRIPIPTGRSAAERGERTARGKEILWLRDQYPEMYASSRV
jgi:hypothetical protein